MMSILFDTLAALAGNWGPDSFVHRYRRRMRLTRKRRSNGRAARLPFAGLRLRQIADEPGDMRREARRQRGDQQRRVGLARSWKDGAAGDKEIGRPVDAAIRIDDALRRVGRHADRADLVVAVGHLVPDVRGTLLFREMMFELADSRHAQVAVDNLMPGDDGLNVDIAVAQIDLEPRHAEPVARVAEGDRARQIGRLLGMVEQRVAPRLVAHEKARQPRLRGIAAIEKTYRLAYRFRQPAED